MCSRFYVRTNGGIRGCSKQVPYIACETSPVGKPWARKPQLFCVFGLLVKHHSPPQTRAELLHEIMDSTSLSVALIGRNSKCKALFLKAASSSEKPMSDSATQTDAWWTPSYIPGLREADIVQAPAHGFSPSGERLLHAQLRHISVADVVEEEGARDGCCRPALLLLVPAEMVFHNGRPRPGKGAVALVKAAVSRARERLGSGEAPIAVAVSVDAQEEDGKGQLPSSSVKPLLDLVKAEMAAEGVPVVAVSPRTELWLLEQESEGGRVSYRRGDSQFRIRPAFEQLMNKSDIARARAAFDTCGGTGITAAISAAVALNPPTLVFPVADFLTLQSSGWGGDGAPAAPLRTCRPMRATSSARDVFNLEKEEGVLNGDLVSAAVVVAQAGSAPPASPTSLELDAPIGKGAWFLCMETNRKATKMWMVGVAGASGGKAGKPLASVQFGDMRSKERRRGRS